MISLEYSFFVFCKDLPAAEAHVMAATQKPVNG